MVETDWYIQACTWHSEERWQWPDTCDHVRDLLENNGYTTVDYIHDTDGGNTADALPDDVVNAINAGRAFYLYRAHDGTGTIDRVGALFGRKCDLKKAKNIANELYDRLIDLDTN